MSSRAVLWTLDVALGSRRDRADRHWRPRSHSSLIRTVMKSARVRLTDRTMIRITALTVLLTFAGTPAATAACLAWCGAPCPPAHSEQRPSVSTGQDSCEKLFVAAPALREDGRWEHQRTALQSPFDVQRTPTLDFEHRSSAFVLLREHAPPAHTKPPTVLRL